MSDELPCWYALRVTYSRELIFKEYCDSRGIINFIPLEYRTYEKNGVKVKKLRPVVHNLIFLKTTNRVIKELKLQYPIRYIMDKATGVPVIIPEKQMNNFIAVAGNHEEQVVFLQPVDIEAKAGARVRIKGGPFEGVEGVFMKVKNNKRVVVQIEGIMVVATHYIHPSLIEVLGD